MPFITAPIPRWLLLCVIAWSAVWCCCVEPVMASPGVHVRECCDEEPTRPDHCPVELPDCPVVKVREQSVAAAPPTLPSFEPVLAWLPTYFNPPSELAVQSGRPVRSEPADPPRPASTLVALHTSLLW